MLADRDGALMARLVDMIQMPAVGMAGDRLDRHRLARQCIGHEDRPGRGIGNAVAAMPEARNGELFGHLAAPSRNSALPSPPCVLMGRRPPSSILPSAMKWRASPDPQKPK